MKAGTRVLVALAFCLVCLLFVLSAAAITDLSDARTAEPMASAPPANDQPATQAPSASSSATERYASPGIAPANPVWVQTGAGGVSTCATSTLSAPIFWDTPPKAGSVVSVGDQQFIQPGPDDQVRVIVRLEGESIASYKSRLRADPKHLSEAERAQVESYARVLRRDHKAVISRIEAQGIALEVRQEYSYILNGFAALTKMADMKRIEKIPGVLGVYPDYEVHALLNESVPLISADQVWAMHDANGRPVTGQGIRVAVIDTGIDYTHPDLGGCFGSGCKVADGYDFVNEDADPQDDNGHGTHVAGIVAANGSVKGVAPGASLFAYKVMDASGNGYTSDIIAAIERATDPDGNPATADAVDVINLSLGGAGDPDDPLALAVDAAVDQGVVVVASAGNGGPGYWTLTSPGIARRAITVGATDKSDQLADFSSRGPVSDFYELLKPDIVAPGVAINSTYRAGGYAGLSGTSMAAPHISGAAALLKQLHPTWTPELIRGNLMNTAKDLGVSVFKAGAGRIQVGDAARAAAVLTPVSLGLGAVDSSQPVWTQTRELRLTNLVTTPVAFTLSVSGTLPAGVTTSLQPGSVSLGAGQSITVTFAITVDNAVTPYPTMTPGYYEAKVVVQSPSQVLAVPFAFSKGARLEVTLDEGPFAVFLIAPSKPPKSGWWGKFRPGLRATFQVPPGTYDLWVDFDEPPIRGSLAGRTWVFREGVEVRDVTRLTISRSDAHHTISLNPQDENGQPINPSDALLSWQFKNVMYPYGVNGHPAYVRVPGAVLHFSDFSLNYSLDWRLDLASSGNWYEFNGRLDGLSSDVTYQNDPAVFRHLTYHFDTGSGQPNLMVSHAVSIGPYF